MVIELMKNNLFMHVDNEITVTIGNPSLIVHSPI